MVRCSIGKRVNYLHVAIFILERFAFRTCFIKLESLVFQVKVAVALFDLESLEPIYTPLF